LKFAPNFHRRRSKMKSKSSVFASFPNSIACHPQSVLLRAGSGEGISMAKWNRVFILFCFCLSSFSPSIGSANKRNNFMTLRRASNTFERGENETFNPGKRIQQNSSSEKGNLNIFLALFPIANLDACQNWKLGPMKIAERISNNRKKVWHKQNSFSPSFHL
jgi:hypothetical protein